MIVHHIGCPNCNGEGVDGQYTCQTCDGDGLDPEVCRRCLGEGLVDSPHGLYPPQPCPKCDGTGFR